MKSKIRLLYITNDPYVGLIAERSGVDWIFLDMEYRGKKERQLNRDTVISCHTLEDIQVMRSVITKSKLMVRINPWGKWSCGEIEGVLKAGADIIMLPFFTSIAEVKAFIDEVGGRAKTCLLFETMAAIEAIDDILLIDGINFVHIGLNDLHIERGTTFMFEFLADGELDRISAKLRSAGVMFGFGGMACIGSLLPPAEQILAEHFRLGSTGVILSRSFCQTSKAIDQKIFADIFAREVARIREQELMLLGADAFFFENNRLQVIDQVKTVVSKLRRG
jgi:2-keto-3-deoxy-L-rhamnonate aldolase RhmA